MKKYIVSFVTLVFMFITINTVQADVDVYDQKVMAENQLIQTSKGRKYKQVLDTFLMTATKEKKQEVKNRLDLMMQKSNYSGMIGNILTYFHTSLIMDLDWLHTYKFENEMYSFDYPTDWSIEETDESVTIIAPTGERAEVRMVEFIGTPEEMDEAVQATVGVILKELEKSNITVTGILPPKNTMINNKSVYVSKYFMENNGITLVGSQFFFYDKGYFYIVNMFQHEVSNTQVENMNHMLSSFTMK